MKRWKTNWIGHILLRKYLLKQVVEGRIEIARRRVRKRKHLLADLKESGEYCKLKEEALDRTLWRTRFGRRYGRFVRLIMERNKE